MLEFSFSISQFATIAGVDFCVGIKIRFSIKIFPTSYLINICLQWQRFLQKFILFYEIMKILKQFFIFAIYACILGCASEKDFITNSKLKRQIGVMLPLSKSDSARDVADGMRMALKKRNSKLSSDNQFQFYFEDIDKKKNSPMKALGRLTENGTRVFCIGFDAEILPVHKLFSSMDGAFFNFLMTYPPASILGKNSTRIFFNSAQEGDMMASFENKSKLSSLTYVIASEDSPIGKSAGDFLAFSLSSQTRKVIREYFSKGENNFDIFATEVVHQNPKVIYYIGGGAEFEFLAKALKKCNYKGLLVKNRGLVAFEKVLFFGKGVVSRFEVEDNFSSQFKNMFACEYGRAPSVFAAWGFDSANILMDAMETSDFQLHALRGNFLNTSYNGAMGRLIFDSSADCSAELLIK